MTTRGRNLRVAPTLDACRSKRARKASMSQATQANMNQIAAQEIPAYCEDLGRRAQAAARALATTLSGPKDQWLVRTAESMHARSEQILESNSRDLAQAEATGLGAAQIDRLRLTPKRLEA